MSPTCERCGFEEGEYPGCRCYEPDPPSPAIEDYCAPHPYHGDDMASGVGRCYCGTKAYALGGADLEDPA